MKDAQGHGSNPRGAHAEGTQQVGAGSTDPMAPAHQAYARQFINWSGTAAFGAQTVNTASERAYMHANNPEVQAANERMKSAQSVVNQTRLADPRLGYKETPPEHLQALADAKSHLRNVEKAARQSWRIRQ